MILKFSIITVCFNSEATISDTLHSVAEQTWSNIEHIIIDGASSDNTLAIVSQYASSTVKTISEPDLGIYDAMNKGLAISTGDVVAFLNSDDCYSDKYVIKEVAEKFVSTDCDFVYGDLNMVDRNGRLVRQWKSGLISEDGLVGSQIPHPVLFVRRSLLIQLSPAFDISYRIAADLKQQLIIVNKYKAIGTYLPRVIAVMRLGGESTASLTNYMKGWSESVRAYNEVFGSGGILFTTKKVLSKISGLCNILIPKCKFIGVFLRKRIDYI